MEFSPSHARVERDQVGCTNSRSEGGASRGGNRPYALGAFYSGRDRRVVAARISMERVGGLRRGGSITAVPPSALRVVSLPQGRPGPAPGHGGDLSRRAHL